MNSYSRAPIASPHDACVLPPSSAPSIFTSVCGHFLGFGFWGQIAYTALELAVASGTHGQKEAHHSVDVQLALLLIPLLCSVAGVVWSCKSPIPVLARPGAIIGYILSGALLGMFNLFVMFLTAMTGYC